MRRAPGYQSAIYRDTDLAERAGEPNRRSALPDQNVTNSDLVEIAKRNGDFRKNYGPLLGAFLYLRSVDAAVRRGSFLRKLLIAIGTAAVGLWLKYTA
jgi:hypothetical protein